MGWIVIHILLNRHWKSSSWDTDARWWCKKSRFVELVDILDLLLELLDSTDDFFPKLLLWSLVLDGSICGKASILFNNSPLLLLLGLVWILEVKRTQSRSVFFLLFFLLFLQMKRGPCFKSWWKRGGISTRMELIHFGSDSRGCSSEMMLMVVIQISPKTVWILWWKCLIMCHILLWSTDTLNWPKDETKWHTRHHSSHTDDIILWWIQNKCFTLQEYAWYENDSQV